MRMIKPVNRHFFSIVVGAGAARQWCFVYNAVCEYWTGTTRHCTAQTSAEIFSKNCLLQE